jgi:hypothetical protein
VIHDFLENIQEAIDEKTNLIGIFFDLSKAQGVLNHKILLSKLDIYGIRGVAYLNHIYLIGSSALEVNDMGNSKQLPERHTADLILYLLTWRIW